MKRITVFLAVIGLFVGGANSSYGGMITGTYSTGPGGDGNMTTPTGPVGPWTLTATATTFSYLLRFVNENITFADLTNLNAVFTSNAGGSGGGSPRFRLLLDYDSTGTISAGDKSISIYLGNSPSFTDSDAVLNTYSGFNLIGNNDAGRYDTSAFVGGSPFTTYSAAVALLGSYQALRLGIVEDTFGTFPDRNLTVESLNGEFADAAAVPEPASLTLLGLSVAASLGYSWRRRPQTPAIA